MSEVSREAMEAAHKAWREQANVKGSIFEYNLRAAVEAAAEHIEKRFLDALAKVELACDAMDAGVSLRAGDPRTKSHTATAIRAAIRESLTPPPTETGTQHE